ncbi:uncharacterized protein il11b [Tachysurus fulvidraco]|uniref:uncharacterized protein il11b n=1 Tax=Tachysurus fulvidraco TaxID=1234273 RepID=UPI001FEE1B66|nr:uncharacterized protein il11b [Tachysurus fulvidraco]
MKLPGSTSCLLFLLLLVEIPVLTVSRPTLMKRHKDGLTKLFQQIYLLRSAAHEAVHHLDTSLPFEHNFTSLPALNLRAKDLAKLKANSTLSQLHSGLHSFKLHYDWLLYWHNQSGLVSDRIQKISYAIHSITVFAQSLTDSPAQNTSLSLPPLTSAWDLNSSSAVIHKRLLNFCSWYLRALLVLISHANR